MSKKHKDKLTIHRSAMIDVLNMDHLVSDLLAAHVLTKQDKEDIDACQTRIKKVDKFLDFMLMKSEKAFYSFLKILEKRTDDNDVLE